MTKTRSGSSKAGNSPTASPNSSRGTRGLVPLVMCKSVPSGFRTTQYPLGAAEFGRQQNLVHWRFLLFRQYLIDQPYDGILCGRARRGVAGFDGLVVQPDAPLP